MKLDPNNLIDEWIPMSRREPKESDGTCLVIIDGEVDGPVRWKKDRGFVYWDGHELGRDFSHFQPSFRVGDQ